MTPRDRQSALHRTVPGTAAARPGLAAALALAAAAALAQDAAEPLDEEERGDAETVGVPFLELTVPAPVGAPTAPAAPLRQGAPALAQAPAAAALPGYARILGPFPVSDAQQHTQMTPVATRDGAVYLVTIEPDPEPDDGDPPDANLLHVVRRGTPDDPTDPDGAWSWTSATVEDRGYRDVWHSSGSVGIDAAGHVHVAYNMHNFPWQHGRSSSPGRIDDGFEFVGQPISLAEILRHVRENRTGFPTLGTGAIPGNQITYPAFENDPEGNLHATYRFAAKPALGFPERTFSTGLARHDAATDAWTALGGPLDLAPGDYCAGADDEACGDYAYDGSAPRAPELRALAGAQGWTSYQPKLTFGPDGALSVNVMWREGIAGETLVAPCSVRSDDAGATFTAMDGAPIAMPLQPGDCPNVPSADPGLVYYSIGDAAADAAGRPHLMLSPVSGPREMHAWDGSAWSRVTEAPPYAVEIFFDADDNLWALTQGIEIYVRRAGRSAFEPVRVNVPPADCLPRAALDPERRTAYVFAYGCAGETASVLRLDLPRLLGEAPAPAPREPLTLARGEWRQVSVPFTRDDMTPRALFGDALGADAYATGWILYRHDGAGGAYAAVPVDAPLEPGRGYWIVQAVADAVAVPVPADARERSAFRPGGCAAPACHRVPEAADGWTLGGLASLRPAALADARVRTADGACAAGCTLAEADAAGAHSPALYAWDPAAGEYATLEAGATLAPWSAYWARAAAPGTELLLPGGAL